MSAILKSYSFALCSVLKLALRCCCFCLFSVVFVELVCVSMVCVAGLCWESSLRRIF